MAGTTIHSLVYKISTQSDLKGLTATKSEISAAKRVMQETRTTTEQYSNSLEALNALHRKGALDAETHRRAIERLNQETKESAKGGGILGGGVAGVAGALGIGFGISEAVGFIKSSIEAATQAAESQARLAAALEATGNTTGFTQKQLLEYSSTLQRLTGISDEAFTDAQAELATFGNIHGKVFTDAIRLSADLSRLYGTDLKSEVEGLGRALANPLEATDRLRIGQEKLTEAEKEHIKTLAESGDILGAQQAILDLVAGKVAGTAEKMRNPLASLTESFGDLKEAVGGLFEAGQIGGKGLDFLTGALNTAATEVKNLQSGGILEKIAALANLTDPAAIVKLGLRGAANGGETAAPEAVRARAEDIPTVSESDIAEGQRLLNEAEKARKDKQRLAENLAKQQADAEERAAKEVMREREQRENQSKRFVEGLLDKAKSPKEKLQEGLAEIQNALGLGQIGTNEAKAAQLQLARDLVGPDAQRESEKPQQMPPKTAGPALMRGTAEAFSAVLRGMDRNNQDPAKKTERNTEKTYQAAEQLLDETKKANAKPPLQVITF